MSQIRYLAKKLFFPGLAMKKICLYIIMKGYYRIIFIYITYNAWLQQPNAKLEFNAR